MLQQHDIRLAKSKIEIDVVKQVNTDHTSFNTIIYILGGQEHVLIEKPNEKKVYHVRAHELSQYVNIKKVKTGWVRQLDGSFMRINNDLHWHVIPLNNEFGYYTIRTTIGISTDYYRLIRPMKTKRFKLNKGKLSNDGATIKLEMTVPMWELWGMVTANVHTNVNFAKEYTLEKMYMKVGDQFYRFPYGNVSANDRTCTGGTNNGRFKKVDQIWINWITTNFNFDYKHNLKARNLYTEQKNRETARLIPVTYDLDHIALILNYGNPEALNIIDMYYYLSNITNVSNMDFTKFFIKHPGIPEKISL